MSFWDRPQKDKKINDTFEAPQGLPRLSASRGPEGRKRRDGSERPAADEPAPGRQREQGEALDRPKRSSFSIPIHRKDKGDIEREQIERERERTINQSPAHEVEKRRVERAPTQEVRFAGARTKDKSEGRNLINRRKGRENTNQKIE